MKKKNHYHQRIMDLWLSKERSIFSIPLLLLFVWKMLLFVVDNLYLDCAFKVFSFVEPRFLAGEEYFNSHGGGANDNRCGMESSFE